MIPTHLLDRATENQSMSWQCFEHCVWNPGSPQASGTFNADFNSVRILSTICYKKCWLLLFKRTLKPLYLVSVTSQIKFAQSISQETSGDVEIPLPSSCLAYLCHEQRIRIWPELTVLLSVLTEKHPVHCYTAKLELNVSTNRKLQRIIYEKCT